MHAAASGQLDSIKELVVVSGKGGTGKTTIAACFAALARDKVLADADVDAADLFILLEPEIVRKEAFRGGSKARIDTQRCVQCGECLALCRYGAISPEYAVDSITCEGCGLCAHFCTEDAITMETCVCGEWYISETRYGPFVHAKLGIGEENSGKLVSVVKHHARMIAEERGLEWIIVDGPPGIGCPVISSITGASAVLIVTEPTVSGIHDMKRVTELAAHFSIPSAVCVNKWDINREVTRDIQEFCRQNEIPVVGRIPCDRRITQALVKRRIVVEHEPEGAASLEIHSIWDNVRALIAHSQARGTK